MKKPLIASLVGALILFVWQFLSWTVLSVHTSEFKYAPNQDKIMEVLNQNLTEEGGYMLPGLPPDSTPEQQEEMMKSSEGKPWASITYHKAFHGDMALNMIRAFAVDLLAAFLLAWMLSKWQTVTMAGALQASLATGVIAYLTIPYLNSIWFENNSLGYLVDALVSWGLVGAWYGWWLPRGSE